MNEFTIPCPVDWNGATGPRAEMGDIRIEAAETKGSDPAVRDFPPGVFPRLIGLLHDGTARELSWNGLRLDRPGDTTSTGSGLRKFGVGGVIGWFSLGELPSHRTTRRV